MSKSTKESLGNAAQKHKSAHEEHGKVLTIDDSQAVFPISTKKCEIFSGIFALKFCEFRHFCFLLKTLLTVPRSVMSQKSRRKVAELRRSTFFFFGEQRKIREKNASVGVMTFFFFFGDHI